MVTKTLVRVSDGAIMSTVAVTAPNYGNRNNHQPPKKNKDGSDDNKIAAKETAVMHQLDSIANNEVDVENMSTTHVTKTTDKNESTATGTRRSNRPKRHLEVDDANSDKKKRRRKQGKKKLIIDLKDVPMQAPIFKHDGKTDGSSSKYLGVHWDKSAKKWKAGITIDGKFHYIGIYHNEEDAAIDYARVVLKYKGGSDGIERLKAEQHEKLDLTDVPKQQLIMKPNGKGSSTSKYKGVSFDKASNKWRAHISIDGKRRYVGNYDNEEDAAADYARAVFKYNGGNDGIKSLKTKQSRKASQNEHDGNTDGISSKYLGVCWNKARNKWVAQITIDGKQHYIGKYDEEEDAAADYARAAFKYKGGSDGIEGLRTKQRKKIDLTGVPKQQLIMKPNGKRKSGSKYLGVSLKTKDENTLTGTNNSSSRPKHPVVFNDDDDDEEEEEEEDGSDKKKRRRKLGKEKLIIGAVLKRKGGNDGIERPMTKQRETLDLKDVPLQVPILKHNSKTGDTSKYVGVCWNKDTKKWQAQITIDGKQRIIGYYDSEEVAADYARAVFECNGGSDGIERLTLRAQQRKASQEKKFIIDLTDVPMQQLIMKPNGKGNSTSKYKGVSFDKAWNRWRAQITIDGTSRHVGSYDNEEDAAADYARAVFKYKGGDAEVKCQDELQQPLNLIQVSAIPPADMIQSKEDQSQH